MATKDIKKFGFFDSERIIFYSFCLMLFLLPMTKSPALIAGGLTIALWVFSGRFIKDLGALLKQKWAKPVLLFIILPWLGLLWTNDFQKGLDFAQKSYYWLFAFAVISIPHTRAINLIWAFIAGLSLNVLVSIFQYIGIIPYLRQDFATGLLTGINPYISYSLILVLGMAILSFVFGNVEKRWQKVLIIILIASYIFNLSIIHGRSGYIAFLVLLPVIIFNLAGKKHIMKGVIAVVFITVIFLFSPMVQNRINLIKEEISLYYQGHKGTSVGLRLYVWENSIKIFANSPLIGVGTGGFAKSLVELNSNTSLPALDQPHNSFLYMATSFGLIGIFSILWLFVVFLKKGWRCRNNLAGYSVFLFGIILIIGSMTDNQILSRITGILLAVFMGMRVEKDE